MTPRRVVVSLVALLIVTIALCGSCGSPSDAATTAIDPSKPGAWFFQKGCTACHSISVYGHQSPSAMGPDLALAVEDTPRRFGRPIEEFLKSPVGTMAIVLSTRIQLTDADREDAIHQLNVAYDLYQLRRLKPASGH